MPYRCPSRNYGCASISSCLRFAAERSLGLGGLGCDTAKMRSSRSISAMIWSTSISKYPPQGSNRRSSRQIAVLQCGDTLQPNYDPNSESDRRTSRGRLVAVHTSAIATNRRISTSAMKQTEPEDGKWKSDAQFAAGKTACNVDQQVSDHDNGCLFGGAAHTHKITSEPPRATAPPRSRCNVRLPNRRTGQTPRRNPASWEACFLRWVVFYEWKLNGLSLRDGIRAE